MAAAAAWLPGRRVASALLVLITLSTLVTGLATLAPATAGAADTPITAYVINNIGNTVTPIDVATNTPGAPIPVGDRPIGIAITPMRAPAVTVTATTLNVIKVPLPLGLGGLVVPTAIVAPPTLAGTVQFTDGTAHLGRPVRVIGGRAIGPVTFLATGPHSLTAVFTPTNPAKFTPSTSNTVAFAF